MPIFLFAVFSSFFLLFSRGLFSYDIDALCYERPLKVMGAFGEISGGNLLRHDTQLDITRWLWVHMNTAGIAG